MVARLVLTVYLHFTTRPASSNSNIRPSIESHTVAVAGSPLNSTGRTDHQNRLF